MARGRLVTFSGLDGCGKSTQIERLRATVLAAGGRPHVVWSRGGYTGGVLLAKRVLRGALGRKAPKGGPSAERTATLQRPAVARLWLSAAMLDLIRLYGVELRARRALGQTVICDRYLWDTLADFQVNFPRHEVERTWLWRLLVAASATPDAEFYLDIDPELSEQRALEKQDPFPEPLEARQRRAAVYARLLAGGRFESIPATDTREAIADRIQRRLGLSRPESTP